MEEGGDVAKAAIAAAGKIGSTSSVKSLLGNLGGPFGQQALTALKSFKGDIRKDVAEALSAKLAEGTDKSAIAGLVALASARKMKEVSPVIFSMLSSSDASLSSLGAKHLSISSVSVTSPRLAACSTEQRTTSRTIPTLSSPPSTPFLLLISTPRSAIS